MTVELNPSSDIPNNPSAVQHLANHILNKDQFKKINPDDRTPQFNEQNESENEGPTGDGGYQNYIGEANLCALNQNPSNHNHSLQISSDDY